MIVNAIWIGERLPLLQRMCLKSWVSHGNQVHLWCYESLKDVPVEIVMKPAEEVFPLPVIHYTDDAHRGSPVLHANLFRYAYLWKNGGPFIETDLMCLADSMPGEVVISSELGADGDVHPNLAYLSFPTRNADLAWECLKESLVRLSGPRQWGLFGPRLLKEMLSFCGVSLAQVRPPKDFCPLGWNETQRLFDAEPPDLSGSFAVHLWQQVLTKTGRDSRGMRYPETSLWEKWKREYA